MVYSNREKLFCFCYRRYTMFDNGLTDKIKGTIKETAGDITNDTSLKAEGLMDKAKGEAKGAISDAKDAAEDVVEKVKDSTK